MKFLEWTYVTIEQPKAWSLVHILVLLLVFMGVLIAIKVAKKVNDKQGNLIVFSAGVFLIAIETYKQFFYTFIYYEGTYGWEYFPYQFCSVPMFLAVLLPFLKEGKVKTAMYSFLGYFMTMSGVMFYLIPSLSHVLSVSIHSMIWHMILIVIGIIILTKGNYGKSYKEIIPGFIVFLILVGLASTMNVVFYHTIVKYTSKTFSMFYISPYFTSSLAVFSDIHKALGWVPLMISYIAACFLAVSLIFVVNKYLKKWCLLRTLNRA
jgi:hypothetical protein